MTVPVARTLAHSGTVVALLVAVLVSWYARDVLLLVFAGVLVGVFLRTIARWVHERTRLPTSVALAAVVVLVLGGVTLLFWTRGPSIAAEFDALREDIPRAASAIEARLQQSDWGRRLVAELPTLEEALPDARSAVGRATGVVSRTFDALTTFVVILFLAVAFAATPRPYVSGLIALVPPRKEARARAVLDRVTDTLWWWMIGRVLSMTVIGVATGIGLWLLGIPLAFTLAFIAALLTFIPNIGPLLAALPAIVLGLAQSPRTALYVALLYAGVQAVETYVLGPVIDRKTVALPPAVTVVAQLLLVMVAGILGAALAAPLAAVVVVLLEMLYVHDVLGRPERGEPAANA
ncbi:MAG TPA: AI-2E family transporter [Gemmatimonas sp.]|nr:AI-2E family transporter [Gemmatimonas sp.]